MRSRGVVQARGHYRAILPQAISNFLAAQALERIPPAIYDQFCARLPARMLKSASRRLSYLHDSAYARATATRWLSSTGPLGDLMAKGAEGFQIIINLAPVAPEAVSEKLLQVLEGPQANEILRNDNTLRHRWICLIKAIGYDVDHFEAAAMLLSRFLISELDGSKGHSAKDAFIDLFHIYLSGTLATPEQRRAVIKKLALSGEAGAKQCAVEALESLLQATHFSSIGAHEFGARSRNWGWEPKINQDIWDWFDEAIALTIELWPHLPSAPTVLARRVQELWFYSGSFDSLERAAACFSREQPWIEGWIAFRKALRFKGEHMPPDIQSRLEQVIDRLKPLDLLNRARAIVISRGDVFDFADGEDDDNAGLNSWEKAAKAARAIGQSLTHADDVRGTFLPELITAEHASYPFEVGVGLAADTDDLERMWQELVREYEACEENKRDARVLSGFLVQANERDPAFTSTALDAILTNPILVPLLPTFQANVGLNDEGIARLRVATADGQLVAHNFYMLTCGLIRRANPEPLAKLLEEVAGLTDGVEMATNILHSYFHGESDGARARDPGIISIGRDLLTRLDFGKKKSNLDSRDYALQKVIGICLEGEGGRDAAKAVCRNIRSALNDSKVSLNDLSYTVRALLKVQPFTALDTFLLADPAHLGQHLVGRDFGLTSPIEEVDSATLITWAEIDAHARYPLLGKCLNMFGRFNSEQSNELLPIFLTILDQAPDKRAFLGHFWDRLHPRSWSGSLADILIVRKNQLAKLSILRPEIREWVTEMEQEIDRAIERERGRDRQREESFE